MESTDKYDPYKPSFAPLKGCRQWSLGCLLILVLFIGFLCSLLTILFGPKGVSAASQEPLAVWLLIDNSNSMYEKAGVGSDPDLLRLDAARLFLSYLGVDERDLVHQAGVIFFGTGAETAVPLTPLTDDARRADLFAEIADPPRMGWTDHLAALQLAQAEIEAAGGENHPAVILLTDGKPEWPDTFTPEQQAAYLAALQTQSQQFAASHIPLFIILLSNRTTDQDDAITNTWRPLWQEMSRVAPPGRFYVARTAGDLPHIYHDIVVTLTGEETAGVVLETQAPESGLEATLTVPADLAQLTLVISKSDPAQQVIIETEEGVPVTDISPAVRRAGGSSHSLPGGSGSYAEEIWVIEEPSAGVWQVRVTGPGEITIWQDYKPLPTASALPTGSAPSTPTPMAVSQQLLAALDDWATAQPALSPTAETAVIVFITPAAPAPLESPSPAPRQAVWTWRVWLGLLLAVAAAAGGVWRHHSRLPHVSGTLRVLGGGRVVRTIDLDSLAQTAVSLGKAPADIPLPAATTVTIVPGARLEDVRTMFIRSDGSITLDGQPARPSAPLADNTLIDLGGGVQVRYENLRLRRAGRLSAHSFKQIDGKEMRKEQRETGP